MIRMSTQPLSSEEFRSIYSKVPRLCVDLIIKMQGGVILTLRNLPDYYNMWHLPGGTVRYKETIEHAVSRIAQEELNLSVKIVRTLGYMEFSNEEKERGFGWAVSIAVLCTSDLGEFTVGKGASEARVFIELPNAMIPEQKAFLSSHWAEIVS
mgnify:CR=1 FL=1